MASHLRTDDVPDTQRVSAVSTDEDGLHSTNQVIDEGVRIEAQDVRSSRKYFYTPDRGKAKRTKSSSHHHHHRSRSTRKRHYGCLTFFIVLLLVLGILGVAGYHYGKEFYASARSVKGKASTALEQVNDLKGQLTSGDYEAAQTSAQQLSQTASEMRSETSTPLWILASLVPVYGGDVSKVRTLAVVFQDLADNALIPVTDELAGLSFSAIVGTEGKIDVDSLVSLTNALSNVSDVINRNTIIVDNLGEARLDEVNQPLQKVRGQMTEINSFAQGALKITPVLSQMLGANGQTRTYLVVAVTPAEMRAGGGFAGSMGILEVTDGKLNMSNFYSYSGLVPGEQYYGSITDEEANAFGSFMKSRLDNVNITPNFPRAGYLYSEMWSKIMGQTVDGVISVDPIVLQRVLALTGGVTISYEDWVVDGDNAAEMLMHTIYSEFRFNKAQDWIFTEIAELAFDKFTSSIGEVGIDNWMNLIAQSAQDHRFQVWMANEEEEAIMESLDISGALETNPTNPVLGVYLNDYSWGKMGWYLDFRTTVDEGTKNADGSTTYHATTIVGNTMTWDESYTEPSWVKGSNPDHRNAGDMCSQVLLFPPAGGSISDVQVSTGEEPKYADVYGFSIAVASFWTNCEETTTITYTVTTAPEALGDLTIRTTPTCRTFE